MAKALKTAAVVVGVAALAVATYGLAIGPVAAGTAGGFLGIASVTATATALTLGAAVLSLGAQALAKKSSGDTTVSQSGSQTGFTSNPDQGLPYAMGRTAAAGWNVHDICFDAVGTTKNDFQCFFGAFSVGPIEAIEAYQVDKTTINFATPNATAIGSYANWMWLRTQLGACPEAAALTSVDDYPYPPGWSASSKLSGLAAYAWTLRFDESGTVYPGASVPQPLAIVHGVHVYDPRLDDTVAGGSGACRALQEDTYVYSENPFLHALTWALGRWQNGKRVIGIGMTLAAIDVPAYAHAANIADANNWKVGGVVYSTDGKLAVLQKILAAGSGAPLQLGGVLSCEVDCPRVSLATITDGDIIADASVVSTPTSSSRINGVIPSFRSEDHDWEIVPATKVAVADYIVADGKPRTKAVTWELVQSADQVAQLAAYAICNAREFGPIVAPLKLKWVGYKPGDALTINSPSLGQQNQLVVIQRRNLDPATAAVTLTMRSETTAKHSFSLGQTTVAPPTPSLALTDRTKLLQPGIDASWEAITGPNKPADNATNTGDPNTIFGNTGRTVGQVEQDVANLKTQTAVDTTPPAVPSGLTATSDFAQNGTVAVTFTWNAVADADFSLYVLRVSVNGGGYVALTTPSNSYVIRGLQPNLPFVAQVEAIDTSSNHSGFSAAYNGSTQKDTVPPGPPTSLSALSAVTSVFLKWQNDTAADLANVIIYESQTASIAQASPLVTVNALPGQPGAYTRGGLATGQQRYYWFASVDTSGNQSAAAGPIQIGTAQIGTADVAYKSLTAQNIAAGTITGTEVQAGTFTGDIFQAGSSLPGSLYIGTTGFTLAAVASGQNNGDPAALINQNATLILPGKILLSGGNTLYSWLYGGDLTKIDGGQIAANTVTANIVAIGVRGVQLLNIAFDTDRSNSCSWSEGYVDYMDENKQRQVVHINAGGATRSLSGSYVLYIWFDRVASANNQCFYAATTTPDQILNNPNNVIVAAYFGGTSINTNYGRTIIDGDYLKTSTVDANRVIISGSITTPLLGAGVVTADKIGVTTLSAITANVGLLRTATSGARTEISSNLLQVFDNNNVLRVQLGVF